jgi:hypothetical protein
MTWRVLVYHTQLVAVDAIEHLFASSDQGPEQSNERLVKHFSPEPRGICDSQAHLQNPLRGSLSYERGNAHDHKHGKLMNARSEF